MKQWLFFLGGISFIILMFFVIFRCHSVEASMFQCDECETHCTSENAIWGFLIISLPVILIVQYIIDFNENGRRTRMMYTGPIIKNNGKLDKLTDLIILHKEGELTDQEFTKAKGILL
jgi:glucan phosphoethanolaminetransferase (alkaline phosphatase superfamily)